VCVGPGGPGDDGRLNVSTETGSLDALGTSEDHIVFTEYLGPLDSWGGVTFSANGTAADSTLRFVDIYNAGSSTGAGAIQSLDTGALLDLQNVTLYSVRQTGIRLRSGFTEASHVFVHSYDEQTQGTDLVGYPVLEVGQASGSSEPAGAPIEDVFKIGEGVPVEARYYRIFPSVDVIPLPDGSLP